MRLAPGTAAQRLEVARALCRRLPGTRAVLADGRISYWQAVRIAEGTAPLDAQTALAVEARVLPKAVSQSVGQLRRSLGRAVIAAGPAAAQAAHERAVAERTVTFCPLPDGIAGLWMQGPAPEVSAVYTALASLADRPRRPDDGRLAGASQQHGPADTPVNAGVARQQILVDEITTQGRVVAVPGAQYGVDLTLRITHARLKGHRDVLKNLEPLATSSRDADEPAVNQEAPQHRVGCRIARDGLVGLRPSC